MPAEVVDLQLFRLARAAAQAEDIFLRRFGLALDPGTRAAELPDEVLAFLIDFSTPPTDFLYQLVIRLLGLGREIGFESLSNQDKMSVLDVYFALLDQFRFECLHRLGWLVSYPGQEIPLVRLALEPTAVKQIKGRFELSPSHPDYPEFKLRRETDGEVVVRRLIPQGVTAFRRHCEQI